MSVEGMLGVSFETWGNVLTCITLLITLVSGYLVVAFAVGERLTRPQVIIVNSIYLLMSIFVLWGTVAMVGKAHGFEVIAYSMAGEAFDEFVPRGDIANSIAIIFSLAIVASLKFMWDIRHPT